MRPLGTRHSGAGLVQQTVQIVAAHDLTLFVMLLLLFVKAQLSHTILHQALR